MFLLIAVVAVSVHGRAYALPTAAPHAVAATQHDEHGCEEESAPAAASCHTVAGCAAYLPYSVAAAMPVDGTAGWLLVDVITAAGRSVRPGGHPPRLLTQV
jgi:hypothetical protein